MPRANDAQLAQAQALMWRLGRLGDRAWAIRADILVACGTVRLAMLSEVTVERVNGRLRDRIQVLEGFNEVRKAGN